jgi:hypothetical protein
LQQEVVVAVYTSYQAAAQLRCVQRIHQHHLQYLFEFYTVNNENQNQKEN